MPFPHLHLHSSGEGVLVRNEGSNFWKPRWPHLGQKDQLFSMHQLRRSRTSSVFISEGPSACCQSYSLRVGLTGADIQLPAKADPVIVHRLGLALPPSIGRRGHRRFTITVRRGISLSSIPGRHHNSSQVDVGSVRQCRQQSSRADMT